MPVVKGKKRGRKSKGSIINYKDIVNNINSEEEPIIAHIPLFLDENDSLGDDTENKTEKENESEYKIENNTENNLEDNFNSIFLKVNNCDNKQTINECSNNLTKCWWCKNCFDTPEINLPENYFNSKFLCSGIFCSYNCALSYNIDLNDEKVWKRKSLLNLLYRKTYDNEEDIIPAPSWKVLKEFGGDITIDEFRSNLKSHDIDFIYLQPPLITFSSNIQKNIKNESMLNSTIMNCSSEFVLKRSKPLKSSRYSLENTMGLRFKKKNKNLKKK
jgi:hypothetical protein